MQIIDRIKEKIKRESISVLKLSNETGISAYKIYKWLDGKGSPKHEDSKLLEQWLNQIEVIPNGGKAKVAPQKSQTVESLANETVADKYVKLLEQQNETLRKRVEIDLIEIRKDVAIMQAVLSGLYTHCVKDEEKDKALYETLQRISKEYSRLR